MTETSTPNRRGGGKKATLAATARAVTKNIIGAIVDKPATMKLPQAVSEIHVSPEDVIPAGTIITEAIALEAGLDEEDIDDLIAGGHATVVEVYAMAAAAAEAEA